MLGFKQWLFIQYLLQGYEKLKISDVEHISQAKYEKQVYLKA